MKYFVIFAFLAIIGSLAAALYFMMKRNDDGPSASRKMARALALRVGLSILLFVCILLAWRLGFLHPTGIASGQ